MTVAPIAGEIFFRAGPHDNISPLNEALHSVYGIAHFCARVPFSDAASREPHLHRDFGFTVGVKIEHRRLHARQRQIAFDALIASRAVNERRQLAWPAERIPHLRLAAGC